MKQKRTILLTIVLALVIIAGGLIAGFVVHNRLQNGLIDNYSEQEKVIGQGVASTLQNKVQDIQNTLYTLSVNPQVQSSNAQVCGQSLQQALALHDLGVGNIIRVNATGTIYCSPNKVVIGLPVSSLGGYVPKPYSNPSNWPFVSRQFTVKDVSGYVVAIRVPVYDASHNFIGAIGGGIYLNQLATSYLNSIHFAKTGYASILDDNGDIFYTHLKNRLGKNIFSSAFQTNGADLKSLDTALVAARSGKTSTVRYTNYLHVRKVASVVPVEVAPGHHWIVLVNVPVSEASSVFTHTGLNGAFIVLGVVFVIQVMIITTISLLNTVRSARLQKAEDQFVSLVSHQLRTPLTSIRLYSEMLSDGLPGKMNSKQSDYVHKIYVSTERMIRLVSDILNVSHISLNRLKVLPVESDLAELVRSEMDEIKPLADAHNTKLEVILPEKPVKVMLDPLLFSQIIHNLSTNAVRYSKSVQGEIKISLQPEDGGGYRLDVSDNGIGIPKKAQKKIFRQFYRADNAVAAIGEGTGLGLYMVKMICKQSGLDIKFVSQEGRGTTFSVTIPASGMKAVSGDRALL